MLVGCKQTELDRKIEAWQKEYPDRDGDCMIYAMKAKAKYERLGIRARLCHGYWKYVSEDTRHAWCEYENNGVWLVDDPAIGNKGYQRWEYTTCGKQDYIVEWWGE